MPSPTPAMPRGTTNWRGLAKGWPKAGERWGTTQAVKWDTQESEAEMLCMEIDELGAGRGTALRVAQSTGREMKD